MTQGRMKTSLAARIIACLVIVLMPLLIGMDSTASMAEAADTVIAAEDRIDEEKSGAAEAEPLLMTAATQVPAASLVTTPAQRAGLYRPPHTLPPLPPPLPPPRTA